MRFNSFLFTRSLHIFESYFNDNWQYSKSMVLLSSYVSINMSLLLHDFKEDKSLTNHVCHKVFVTESIKNI